MRRLRLRLALVTALVAIAGPSCGDDGPTGPVAGMLAVRLTTPQAGTDGAVLFTVAGPAAIISATAPAGLRVFHDGFGATTTTFVVTGDLPAGPILTIGVSDVRQVTQYGAAIQQVAAADYTLRALGGYALTVAR